MRLLSEQNSLALLLFLVFSVPPYPDRWTFPTKMKSCPVCYLLPSFTVETWPRRTSVIWPCADHQGFSQIISKKALLYWSLIMKLTIQNKPEGFNLLWRVCLLIHLKKDAYHASQTSVSMVTSIESFRFEDEGDFKGRLRVRDFLNSIKWRTRVSQRHFGRKTW